MITGGSLAVGMGGFLVYTTMSMAALERRRELATMRTLGGRRRTLMLSFLGEAAVLGLIGALDRVRDRHAGGVVVGGRPAAVPAGQLRRAHRLRDARRGDPSRAPRRHRCRRGGGRAPRPARRHRAARRGDAARGRARDGHGRRGRPRAQGGARPGSHRGRGALLLRGPRRAGRGRRLRAHDGRRADRHARHRRPAHRGCVAGGPLVPGPGPPRVGVARSGRPAGCGARWWPSSWASGSWSATAAS